MSICTEHDVQTKSSSISHRGNIIHWPISPNTFTHFKPSELHYCFKQTCTLFIALAFLQCCIAFFISEIDNQRLSLCKCHNGVLSLQIWQVTYHIICNIPFGNVVKPESWGVEKQDVSAYSPASALFSTPSLQMEKSKIARKTLQSSSTPTAIH